MYVRYKSQAEAQVTQSGWELATSQRLHDSSSLSEQQPFMNADSPLYSGYAPTHVNLRIIESPAEFAVPVKQDRCGHLAARLLSPLPSPARADPPAPRGALSPA